MTLSGDKICHKNTQCWIQARASVMKLLINKMGKPTQQVIISVFLNVEY